MFAFLTAINVALLIAVTHAATVDRVNCGVDEETSVFTGNVSLSQYPWVGVFYYKSFSEVGESRAVTTVVLIHHEFVIGPAADLGLIPKHDFRKNSYVLLGQNWNADGIKVKSYVIHPDYAETYNTIAIVQLAQSAKYIKTLSAVPVCPPPDILKDPEFYLIKFDSDYNKLQKQVIPVEHVPGKMCKQFYVSANLYTRKMRPPYVTCTICLSEHKVCVWEAGGALVVRDIWGRWQLLGIGVRGPGCGAPARFLDMLTYFPWVEASLDKFRRLTISKISKAKFVLRSSGSGDIVKYGQCDKEETLRVTYRDSIVLITDNRIYQFLTYNMSIYESVEYTCLILEVTNASAVTEMRVKHYLTRKSRDPPCYSYMNKRSVFEISVYIMFSDKCRFDMIAYGKQRTDTTPLNIQEWKWEEGTYYDDFSLSRVEYRGTMEETGFGFEPLDEKMWVPQYDLWTTTDASSITTTEYESTTPIEFERIDIDVEDQTLVPEEKAKVGLLF